MLHAVLLLCFSAPSIHLHSSLSCLVFHETLFEGSLFLCIGLEHDLLAQRSLLLPTFWSLFLSIHQTHSPSSLVPLLMMSCDPLEEERRSGFGCFHPFCAGFVPSLWIYLPVVFLVGDFQMEPLFQWTSFCWWSYFFLFFSFPCNSQVPLL